MYENLRLGVNVDHVATLREARGTRYPDPVHAALQAELAGANSITMHLREDRRHIQDDDVWGRKIIARVTAVEDSGNSTVKDLRRVLRKQISLYKIPADFSI